MKTYLALLRGVNVGGKSLLKMADLKLALEKAGLMSVKTYIQSGNVIFQSQVQDEDKLAAQIASIIEDAFKLKVGVSVFLKEDWQKIIAAAPKWWGQDKTWKHNLMILIKPYDIREVEAALGTLKPDIESVQTGLGVIYQSMSFTKFGQTSSSKLVGKPAYKQMTIRNFNTANKLNDILSL